jgi:hypothetical protein
MVGGPVRRLRESMEGTSRKELEMNDIRIRVRSNGSEGPVNELEVTCLNEITRLLDQIVPFLNLEAHDELTCVLHLKNGVVTGVEWVMEEMLYDDARAVNACLPDLKDLGELN